MTETTEITENGTTDQTTETETTDQGKGTESPTMTIPKMEIPIHSTEETNNTKTGNTTRTTDHNSQDITTTIKN